MIRLTFGCLCVVLTAYTASWAASPWRPARGPLPASFPQTTPTTQPIVSLGLPIGSPVVRARPDDDPLVSTPGVGIAPPVPMLGEPVEMTPEERYNHGMVDLTPSGKTATLAKPLPADQPTSTAKPRPAALDSGEYDLAHESHFGEFFNRQFQGLTEGRPWFQSDHCFDRMISPVTNPFLFEDPRTLTEIRPIFMYQSIPTNNPWFNGGSALFVGTQARLTLIPNRFSVTLNKFGGTGSVSDQQFADAQRVWIQRIMARAQGHVLAWRRHWHRGRRWYDLSDPDEGFE